MHRRAPWVALALVPLLLLTACAGDDDAGEGPAGTNPTATPTVPDAGPPQSGGTLVYGLSSETNSWDATTANWSSNGWTVARTVFDTLMMFDEDLELKPYLAESFEPNDDYTVWTITTREGVTFHNGEVLDAEVVKANIDRHITSPLTGTVFGPVESVEVTDPRTVVITLDRPWVKFPIVFTSAPGIMMAPEMMADPDGGTKPIGTGPFVFESWIPDDELTVTRNDDYWNGTPYLDGIEFKVITDHNTRAVALRNGELDAATISLANDLVDFQAEAADGDVQMISPRGESTEVFFLMNLDRAPFDDLRVRQALAHAIDKQTLIDTLREGLYEPANGMYPPESPWYAESGYPQYDPEQARQLVDEYEAENGPIEFTIGTPQEAATVEAMQAVQAQLAEVGIDTDINQLEGSQYISTTLLGDYDMNVWQFYSSPHPDGEYVWLHSDFAHPPGELALNFGRIRDDEIDAALEEARGETDPERQKELYATVQQRMGEEAYHLWLYHDYSAMVANPDVHGTLDWTYADGTPGAGMINVQPLFTTAWMEQ